MTDCTKNTGTTPVKVEVNPAIYPLDVIYSAAYKFLEDFYVIIEGNPKKSVFVTLTPKPGGVVRDDPAGMFNNELINYSFYKRQSERNSDIRKSLMQRALLTAELSKSGTAGCGEDPSKDSNYLDDPEGIAIPWEEKYGKGSKKKDGG
jgi:His-Xaa-Ser system protein HxsD